MINLRFTKRKSRDELPDQPEDVLEDPRRHLAVEVDSQTRTRVHLQQQRLAVIVEQDVEAQNLSEASNTNVHRYFTINQ